MLTVRTSENTVITSFRLISERQDFSSVRTGENTVRARARIQVDGILRRKPKKVAVIAIANKLARQVWAMANKGESFKQMTILTA